MVKEDITKMQQLLCFRWPNRAGRKFSLASTGLAGPVGTKLVCEEHLQMEMEISDKVERLTRILSEEANKFPRITVDPYSTGTYGYDWKVYLDQERQLGTIAFTTEVTLSEKELRAAFRHELKALVRSQVAPPVPAMTAGAR
jgi:hypothetical protein